VLCSEFDTVLSALARVASSLLHVASSSSCNQATFLAEKKRKKPLANDSLNNALAAFAATALIGAWSSSRNPLQPLPSSPLSVCVCVHIHELAT